MTQKITSVQALNEKMWYRILKVIYAITGVLIFVLGGALVVDSTRPQKIIDSSGSFITCNDGRTFTFAEIGVNELYATIISHDAVEKANFSCYYNENDPVNINPDNFVPPWENGDNLFKATWKYSLDRSWASFVGFIVLYLLGAYIAYEGIKRVFYYVLFGKWQPSAK